MIAFIHTLLKFSVLCVCIFRAGLVLAADAIPGEELCIQAIDRIVFSGNRVTKPQVLLRELDQQVNEPCSIDLIVDSTQSIMDLGLFSTVLADLATIDGQLQLQFTVTEKLYFLAIPRFSRTSDAELRAGAQLRFDNFLGRLHQMRITSETRKEDDGDGPGGFVHSLDYNIPRFFGSDYGLAFELATDRRKLNLALNGTEFGTAQSETQTLGLLATRWTRGSRGVQGLRYFFGFRYRDRTIRVLNGEAGPYVGGDDIAAIVGVENKQLHQDLFRRRGTVVGGSLSFANSSTGSDFSYTRADLYGAAYFPLPTGIRNINVQGRLGLSDGAAFGENSYSIGGGELLRGMQKGQTSGDVMALVNVEYLHALFDYPQWRWVLFGDVGNVYRRDDIDLIKLRVRGGVGLRWKLLALSNTDLRVDVAWDANREKAQAYVSSNLTF